MRRRRATIQLASSLRYLGNAGEAAELLAAELHAASDELDGAVHAFLALALVDLGREREAVATSLLALSRYLPRYNRSLVMRGSSRLRPGASKAEARAEPSAGGAQPRTVSRAAMAGRSGQPVGAVAWIFALHPSPPRCVW